MTLEDDADFAELLEKVRKLPPMTPDEQFAQRLDFVYGNLACSTRHKPTREAFAELAKGYGWSFERFAKWAEGKEWAE